MRPNRELALAIKRALATGTIALCGAGAVAAYAQPAATAQPSTTQVSAAKAAAKTTTAKATSAKAPILLAQATQTTAAPLAAPAEPATLQTVVVTGTLIARPQAETAEAITIVKGDMLKNQGIVNVEQALNTLTNNVPTVNISSTVGSFSGGGTYANLRGLGDGRTLVLLDGQRLANNANDGNAVDLSGIPFSAIDNIQVLREGASAEYGSDAISGVINFITKKNYQGAEVEANFDEPQEQGGSSGYGNFTLGHGDLVSDGYNVMLTGSYTEQQQLRAAQRSFTAAGYYPALGVSQTNDPGTWPATIVDNNNNYYQPGYPACAGNNYLTTSLGNCAYRYSAATDLLPKSSAGSGLLSITKALPANNQLQLQYLYTRSMVNGWSGPMFYEFGMTPQADPTYFPKSGAGLTCEFNGTTGGPCGPIDLTDPITAVWTDPANNRYGGDLNTEQRALLSFSGDNADWDYKLNLNYSQNKSDQRNTGGIPDEAVLAPGGTLSNLINPFGPQSAAGQALINSSYLQGTYANGEMKRWSFDGNATHPLGDAFNSGTPATVALGFSIEGDNFSYATTPYNDLTHAATGFTDTSIEGSRTAQALFIELDIPMAKNLDFDVSDREDRYSDFGRTNNGKVTLRYSPFKFLTFRGAASTGFRAPTLYDLYSPNNIEASTGGSMGVGNPFCNPPQSSGTWTTATCSTQGLGVFGGNAHLTPETSQNFDFGAIFEPIPNMGVTLDYYRILLKNTIGAIPAEAIYGNPTAFANEITLNNQGTLTPSIAEAADCTPYTLATCGYITLTDENTGQVTTDGFDLSVQYLQHTALGTFREDLEGTSVTQFRLQEYTGGPTLNLVGWFNQGNQPAFRWEHELRLDWTSPGTQWGGGLSDRFYSSYIDEYPDGNGNQRTVGSQSIWDAYASVKPLPGMTVLFGIQNLLNTDPPFSNAGTANFAAGYDPIFSNPIGRDFYLNVTYKFF
ncbi:MAG TPA: TonB-dependent receptor [Steroidobacteraceae bacterium]|jgi:iron complex outermembrane receptor protein|nr:TonB-dependent receptor [Steroidobacteraceae bacterium]